MRCVKTLSEFCFIVCLQLETPEVLKTVPWLADYKPPGIPDENTMTKKTPEEIEREIKLQGTIKILLTYTNYVYQEAATKRHFFRLVES